MNYQSVLRTAAAPIALLALAGASPAQTINVEIDYMVASDHTHKPTTAEINAVVQMFACRGYTLNVFVDDALPHTTTMRCDDPDDDDFFDCTSSTFTTFREIRNANFDSVLLGGWHYCVFGHNYDAGSGTGSSGIAEVGGNDFVVTLGSFAGQVGTSFARASTFAHELGHNLGLRHWGQNSSLVTGPFAPNYASIMSYQYQLNGVASQMQCLGLVTTDHLLKDLDYSSGRFPTLPEAALNETLGVGIHRVDWNCNGTLNAGTVSRDLDSVRSWCSTGISIFGSLRDYDDWSTITDSSRLPSVIDGTAVLDIISCITSDEAQAMRDARSGAGLADPSLCGSGSPSIAQSCPSAQMVWLDPAASGVTFTGTGDDPIANLALGAAISPAGSIFYLQPGTYTNGGNAVTLTRRVLLTGPGGAFVDP